MPRPLEGPAFSRLGPPARELLAGLEKWLPLFEGSSRLEENLGRHGPARANRCSEQVHPGLVGCAPPFAQVAGAARSHEIFPRITTAARARDDVIDVEIAQRRPARAVLALVPVAQHQVLAREA